MIKMNDFLLQNMSNVLMVIWLVASLVNSERTARYASPSRIQRNGNVNTNRLSNYIFYNEIQNRLEMFPNQELNKGSIRDFNEMAIDYENGFLYVGAKNHLAKLSIKNNSLQLLNEKTDLLSWEPDIDTINECRRSIHHNSAKHCQNYIRLILIDEFKNENNRVLVCGTYANRPTCTWRSKSLLSSTLDTFDGIGKCPHSPESSLTYLRSNNGDVYFATSIDYSEHGMRPDFLIDRSMGPLKQIRTDQFNSNWLNDPIFVASIEIGNFIYFFIRETAIEYMNCGQKIYSRVVRLCKYDQGTTNYNVWKTFEKARLNCSVPGDAYNETYSSGHQYSFYYDEIQHVHYDKQNKIIYAIFTTPKNGVKGSAVCAYDVEALEKAFDGPFKHQKAQDSIWEPFKQTIEETKCEPSMKPSKRSNSHNFQLKDLSVQPLYEQPILIIPNSHIKRLVVDNVLTKHNDELKMLFISTEYNTILKYMILNMLNSKATFKTPLPTTCLLEELEILDSSIQPDDSINSLKLLSQPTSRSLLIATSSSLVKMSIANCAVQNNYFSCLSLMDPYCIWDSKAQKCLLIFQTNETKSHTDRQVIARNIYQNSHLHQHSINSCPTNDIPIDGGFSDWTEWKDCKAQNGENCKCRMRLCNSPEPRNGGKVCDEKSSIEILNCEVHGGWTAWSAWSDCKGGQAQNCENTYSKSLSSQPSIRTRFRTCTNPEPKHNGRICIGLDQEEEVCTNEMINPCVRLVNENQWMNWGAWEACSKNCGGGFQMRRRLCNSKMCFGCNQEWRTCNTHQCGNKIENIATEWNKIDYIEGTMQKIEERKKVTCKFDSYLDANGLDGMELNATSEYRLCKGPNSCKSIGNLNQIGKFSEWSDWSICVNCNDKQYRTRKCNKPNTCFGLAKELKNCPCSKTSKVSINKMLSGQIPTSFSLVHLIIACALTFLLGTFMVLFIIFICFKSKSKGSRSICCCSKKKQNSSFSLKIQNNDHQGLSDDQNSLETDTATTDILNSESTKLQYCMASSDSSCTSANSNHSKDYFTIGNRFEQSGFTSLLNGMVPDDAEDELNTFNLSNNLNGTLSRNSANQIPNKSFNTYTSHKDFNTMNNKSSKSSGNNSGLSVANARLSTNSSNINAANRLSSNYGIANSTTTGSIRASMKPPRSSFAFTMRTNLDQEL